jgi:hypothetical protein
MKYDERYKITFVCCIYDSTPITPRQEHCPYARPFDYLSAKRKVKGKFGNVKVKRGKVVPVLN